MSLNVRCTVILDQYTFNTSITLLLDMKHNFRLGWDHFDGHLFIISRNCTVFYRKSANRICSPIVFNSLMKHNRGRVDH